MQTKYYCKVPTNNFIISSNGFSAMLFRDDDDKKNLNFNIDSNDYFGTLAKILDFSRQITEQKINELSEINQAQCKLLNGLKDDLLHLQKNYKIVKKTK